MRKMVKNMAKKAKKTKKRASPKPSTAFHGKAKDGRDVVEVKNLRVIIVKDDDVWFGQGLEIDYAVQGSSPSDVKKKFERGLCATIHENLKAFGHIENMLRLAPQDVWNDLFYNPSRKLAEYSSVSLHALSDKLDTRNPQINLPFNEIRFAESQPAA
jgi:hypothetical protein